MAVKKKLKKRICDSVIGIRVPVDEHNRLADIAEAKETTIAAMTKKLWKTLRLPI